MPTGIYVRRNAVEPRLRAGMAAGYAEDFGRWLRERHYSSLTIAEIMRLLACWTGWARENGYGFATIREAYAASFALIKTGYRRRYRGDMGKDAVETAKLFIAYLEDRGALERPPVPPEPALLSAFMAWARDQHGLAASTLGTYGRSIRPFIAALGEDPARYDATSIRNHMLARAKTVSAGRLKGIRTAIRAFLRFLIACGRCPPGLDHAMPNTANWQLAALPRYLQEADIVRVLAACEGEQRLRDRAIILLLARLGLRASEVAGLTFDAIDWHSGTIRLLGKGRRQELLPLSQEIGDAIIAYIARARPSLPTQAIFVTQYAPIRPITRIGVKCLVRRALLRAGVDSPHKGAHILRHTAATTMLRHGVSLGDVGKVLRHRSPAMTAHYAKVDIDLLAAIAQPWPGRPSC